MYNLIAYEEKADHGGVGRRHAARADDARRVPLVLRVVVGEALGDLRDRKCDERRDKRPAAQTQTSQRRSRTSHE